ncbi:MAG: hypothetical protein ABIF19_21200 [Planctomycetota bacterium]
MVAVFTFHLDKTIAQVAAVEIPINDFLQIRPPKTVLPGEMIIINLDKGFKIVLYAAIIHALFMVYFQRPLCLLAFGPILLTS